jgi:hypothetical protein
MAGGFLTSENAIREIERKPFDASVAARSMREAGLGMQSAFPTKLNFRKARANATVQAIGRCLPKNRSGSPRFGEFPSLVAERPANGGLF